MIGPNFRQLPFLSLKETTTPVASSAAIDNDQKQKESNDNRSNCARIDLANEVARSILSTKTKFFIFYFEEGPKPSCSNKEALYLYGRCFRATEARSTQNPAPAATSGPENMTTGGICLHPSPQRRACVCGTGGRHAASRVRARHPPLRRRAARCPLRFFFSFPLATAHSTRDYGISI